MGFPAEAFAGVVTSGAWLAAWKERKHPGKEHTWPGRRPTTEEGRLSSRLCNAARDAPHLCIAHMMHTSALNCPPAHPCPPAARSAPWCAGEVTHRHLRDRPGPWWQQAVGRRCLHFTWAARGAISLEGLGLEVTQDPQQVRFADVGSGHSRHALPTGEGQRASSADATSVLLPCYLTLSRLFPACPPALQAEFILAHGTEALGVGADGSSVQPCSLGAMRALLGRCAACGGLPMIVANPDVVTVSGSELR